MGRSSETFSKQEKEKKKLKKRKQKLEEKARRAVAKKEKLESGTQDDMIAYVDEFGNIVDTPPDPAAKKKIKAENIEIGIPRRQEEPVTRKNGILDFFNDQKGFGFIREIGSGERFFVHVSGFDTEDDILEGDKVFFDLEKGPRGMNAVRVTKA